MLRATPDNKIILAHEPQAGVARARNRGLSVTQAPLIAMGDDDATMPPDWLESYLARFAELGDDVVLIGGEVIPNGRREAQLGYTAYDGDIVGGLGNWR